MLRIGVLLIFLKLVLGFNKIPQSRAPLGPLFDVLEDVALAPVPVQFMDIQPAFEVQISEKSWMSVFKPNSGLIPIFESSQDAIELPPATPTIPRIGAWKSLSDTKIDPASFKSRVKSQLAGSLAEYLEGTFTLDHVHSERATKKRSSLASLNEEDNMLVAEALRISYIALWDKKTARSVEDKFSRARGIAAVLGELRADTELILAGILHEVVSLLVDTQEFFLLEELNTRFGQNVITLARNYSKLPKFMANKNNYNSMRESENQLQMLVTAHEDYRTLYIRIADRVHTMRELKNLPLDESEMNQIATEAKNLYAPLAHKMGLSKSKGELEDLSFSILQPKEFRLTKETQVRTNKAHHDAEYSIRELIAWDPLLSSNGVNVKITSRVKGKYQLHLKAERKGLKHTNDVRDALGMRLILEVPFNPNETEDAHETRSQELCYHLVEKIRTMKDWEAPSDGFKDYIAGSKENNYQSLHQYLKSKAYGSFVEVQVRTMKMHVNAEHGEAAHWHYKDMLYRDKVVDTKLYKTAWRSKAQLDASNPKDLFGMAKEQLLANRVFVLLDDQSTVINLKKGCVALDAAFAIHSEVGLKTTSILIDGKPVKFNEELKHGQVIKVIRSQTNAVPLLTKLPWIGMLRDKNAQQIMRKHLRETYPDVLVVIGLIQLLNTFMLNEVVIKGRLGDKPLNLQSLQRLAKIRCNGLTFEQFLSKLGSTYARNEIGNIVGNLFDIPGDSLKVSEFHRAFSWARMQAEEWEDAKVRDDVILPFFNSASGKSESVKKLWYDLVGVRSLEARVPVVSSVLSSSLQSVTGSRLTSRVSSRSSVGNKFTVSRTAKSIMKPYSLVASSMPQGLMKAAKHAYANRAIERQLAEDQQH